MLVVLGHYIIIFLVGAYLHRYSRVHNDFVADKNES
jgi:hypothetical protein